MSGRPRPRRAAGVLGLISADHFFSHFYYLVLPPLFPLLTEVYGVGYTELGIALMAMSLGNTLTAAPVGVLVDRYGARTLLIGGLALAGLCHVLIPLFPTFGALVFFMTLVGIANSVFHPANYAILDAVIPDRKVGRAFSVHTFGGYLGTAAAPATVILLEAHSDWQTAVMVSGAAGLLMAGVLLVCARHIPDVRQVSRRHAEADGRRRRGAIQVLFSGPVLLGLVFFAVLAFAEIGISDFGVSSIHLVYSVPLTAATIALSAYLFAAPVGVLMGGWLADAFPRHDLVAAVCMTGLCGLSGRERSAATDLGGADRSARRGRPGVGTGRAVAGFDHPQRHPARRHGQGVRVRLRRLQSRRAACAPLLRLPARSLRSADRVRVRRRLRRGCRAGGAGNRSGRQDEGGLGDRLRARLATIQRERSRHRLPRGSQPHYLTGFRRESVKMPQ